MEGDPMVQTPSAGTIWPWADMAENKMPIKMAKPAGVVVNLMVPKFWVLMEQGLLGE
jgi:hypothetical protein